MSASTQVCYVAHCVYETPIVPNRKIDIVDNGAKSRQTRGIFHLKIWFEW